MILTKVTVMPFPMTTLKTFFLIGEKGGNSQTEDLLFFFYIHVIILIFDIGFLWLLDRKFGKYSFTEIFWYTTLYLLTISQKTNSIRHVPWPMIQLQKFSNTQVLPFCISKQETQQGSKFFL